jgi:hypothetical protein
MNYDDEYTNYGTMDEQVAQWIWAYGAESPDKEWMLSPFDTWHRNPHFTGVRTEGHPEDDYE